MFDKLIESNSEQAEFKPRRKFFMVSSVVVGVLFLSAVVASLYAQDIDLGTDAFEIAELLAPVAPDVPEPDPPREQPERNNNLQETSDLPNRRDPIANINHTPLVPNEISTVPSTKPTIPDTGRFTNFEHLGDSNGRGDRGGPPGNGSGVGASASVEPNEVTTAKLPEPPPVAPKPPTVKSEGVINGKATYLPVPAYPPPARAIGASGVVNVQVTIDEAGKVISSKAISGHPLLRQTAESAAWKARFSTTYLSRVPVKVTGIIAFHFKRS